MRMSLFYISPFTRAVDLPNASEMLFGSGFAILVPMRNYFKVSIADFWYCCTQNSLVLDFVRALSLNMGASPTKFNSW